MDAVWSLQSAVHPRVHRASDERIMSVAGAESRETGSVQLRTRHSSHASDFRVHNLHTHWREASETACAAAWAARCRARGRPRGRPGPRARGRKDAVSAAPVAAYATPMRFGRKPRSTTAPAYIGFADEHPALVGTMPRGIQNSGNLLTTADETATVRGESSTRASAQSHKPRSSSSSDACGGSDWRRGLPANEGSARHEMMNCGKQTACASRSKAKTVRMRLGVVKAKVTSLQLVLAESASMSSSTATRYMRASDTNTSSLAEQLQLGTPTPRSRHRESLRANLMAQGSQSATSVVAPSSTRAE